MKHRKTAIASAAALALALSACGEDAPAAGDDTAAAEQESGSLTAQLENADDLSTAAELVEEIGFDDLLDEPTGYTLFLPVDSVFANMAEARLDELRSEEGRPELVALLRAHMAPGYMDPADVSAAFGGADEGSATIASMGGGTLTLNRADGALSVGNAGGKAKIVGEPIRSASTIVYRIDGIIPPG